MAFNPIDAIRSQEASQYKYIENSKQHNEQLLISKNFQQNIQHEQTKPNQAAKSEDKEFRYDAKEKGKNQYNGFGGRKKEKEDQKKKDTKDPAQHRGFDILI